MKYNYAILLNVFHFHYTRYQLRVLLEPSTSTVCGECEGNACLESIGSADWLHDDPFVEQESLSKQVIEMVMFIPCVKRAGYLIMTSPPPATHSNLVFKYQKDR